jgi:SAM-dependent methyltransferase
MHAEVMAWLRERAADLPAPERVLEVGSLNINGTARDAWPGMEPGAAWLGVDVVAGRGVELTADASSPDFLPKVAASAGMAQARSPKGGLRPGFDLVVCCEALEHAEQPAAIVRNAALTLRPGGAILITCAGEGRLPHSGIDGGPLPEGEHYANVKRDELEEWLTAAGLAEVTVFHFPGRGDLYAVATKPETGGTKR